MDGREWEGMGKKERGGDCEVEGEDRERGVEGEGEGRGGGRDKKYN